ncbi:MAG: hypothetical protein IPK21_21005 [Haliscomenobacter sp.]|nr:hypothetical protein [Haliscomenobacter sp.]
MLINHIKNQLNLIDNVEKKEKPEFNKLRNHIMNGRLKEALKELAGNLENSNQSEFNSIILLTSRFNALSENFNLGLISFEEYSISSNQITYALLEFLNRRE